MRTIHVNELPDDAQEKVRNQARSEDDETQKRRQAEYDAAQKEEKRKKFEDKAVGTISSFVKKKSKKSKAKKKSPVSRRKPNLVGKDIQAVAMQSTSPMHGGRSAPPDLDLGFGDMNKKKRGPFDLL